GCTRFGLVRLVHLDVSPQSSRTRSIVTVAAVGHGMVRFALSARHHGRLERRDRLAEPFPSSEESPMSSQVPIRADLDSLPAYVPGRSVPGAIKLASNESPEGPLPSVVDAITAATQQGNRYPDMGSWDLVERLAREFDVEQEQLAVGCGSVALCQQVIEAVCEPGDEVMFGWRSFEAYPIVTQVARAQP